MCSRDPGNSLTLGTHVGPAVACSMGGGGGGGGEKKEEEGGGGEEAG